MKRCECHKVTEQNEQKYESILGSLYRFLAVIQREINYEQTAHLNNTNWGGIRNKVSL